MAIAIGRGTLTLWQALSAAQIPPAVPPRRELGRLIAQAPRCSRPFEFLAGLLVDSRMRFLSRLGSEANDALDALLGPAMRLRGGASGTSLAGFVNWFAAGEIEIKRNMEQGCGRGAHHDGARRQGPGSAHRHPCRHGGGTGHAAAAAAPAGRGGGPRREASPVAGAGTAGNRGHQCAEGRARRTAGRGVSPPALCRHDAGAR